MNIPNPGVRVLLSHAHVEGGDGEEDGEPSSSPPPRDPIVHSEQDVKRLLIRSRQKRKLFLPVTPRARVEEISSGLLASQVPFWQPQVLVSRAVGISPMSEDHVSHGGGGMRTIFDHRYQPSGPYP